MEQHFIESRAVCPSCGGNGLAWIKETFSCVGDEWVRKPNPCYRCAGRGYVVTRTPLLPLIGGD